LLAGDLALPCSSGLIFEQAWLQIAPGRRALAGRSAIVVQGCKERQLACLCGSGGGQLRATQFKNVFPAVKLAVDDDEGGAEENLYDNKRRRS
jgi:hypothetical protein